jgi:putative AlgH/UPF0301 family transcriptional regulator
MASSAWFAELAKPQDVFAPHDEDLWRSAVRRKGKAFETLSMMPFDPTLN